MAKKLTVVMLGEATAEERGVDYVTAAEKGLLRDDCGMAMDAAKEMTDGDLEYELGHFVVNAGGGSFVRGVYPYFTAEGWLDCSDYEKFYFGGLMLKIDGVWYLADWIDPDGERYEMVTFEEMPSFEAAFRRALEMAMVDYVKKTA